MFIAQPKYVYIKANNIWFTSVLWRAFLCSKALFSLSFQPELTVTNFPALFALKKPFTILFDENVQAGSGAHGMIGDVISSTKKKNSIFCWMDLYVCLFVLLIGKLAKNFSWNFPLWLNWCQHC